MVKRHLKMTQNLPLLNYITYEHSCNAIWQLLTIASKISAHKVQTLVNHKHELHLWSLHFSSFRLCQVVFIFKFVWLLNQGRGKGKLHGDARGFLDPDYMEMVSQRCPKDCLHFSSKTGTHILFRDGK